VVYRCKKQCLSVFTNDEKKSILEVFNQMKNKDEQDIYIQRLMELHSEQRKRSRLDLCAEQAKPKSVSVKYFVTYGTKKQMVCKSTFLSVFGITKNRCERIILFFKNNLSPRDKRGKNVSGNALSGDITNIVVRKKNVKCSKNYIIFVFNNYINYIW